jgi:hypothetical protein
VDLTKVTELDIAAALRGEPILTTNGLDYGMQPAGEQGEVLLLPFGNPVFYKQKTKVERTFRLRQVSSMPKSNPVANIASNGSSNKSPTPAKDLIFTAQVPGRKKEPRKQPEKLGYKLAPLGIEKPVPVYDNSMRLAKSIPSKAAAQSGAAADADSVQTGPSPEKRKKEKKKKKSKTVDEVAA